MPEPTTRRVLVVDDEAAIRDILVDFFDSRGFAVEDAETAAAGLAALRERPASVVLLDLHLPGSMSAVELVAAFAQQAPVIVVSGTNDAELARTSLRQGAFDFVTKPFDLNRLATLVDAAVTKRRTS